MIFEVPIRLRCGPNVRLHWAERAKRVKAERRVVRFYAPPPRTWRELLTLGERFRVTLTRVAPQAVDSDNLQGLLKHARDEVAALLGIDDGDARLTWSYTQEKGGPKRYAVKVVVEPLGNALQANAAGSP